MSCLNFSIRCNLRSNQTVLWHPSDRTYWRTAGQKRSLPHVVCSHTWWLTATKAIHLCLRHSGQSQSSTKPTEILVQVDFLARPCLHESTIKKRSTALPQESSKSIRVVQTHVGTWSDNQSSYPVSCFLWSITWTFLYSPNSLSSETSLPVSMLPSSVLQGRDSIGEPFKLSSCMFSWKNIRSVFQ